MTRRAKRSDITFPGLRGSGLRDRTIRCMTGVYLDIAKF